MGHLLSGNHARCTAFLSLSVDLKAAEKTDMISSNTETVWFKISREDFLNLSNMVITKIISN